MRRAGRSQMPLRSVRRSSGMPVTGPQPSSSTGLTRHATAASKWCSSLERLLNQVHADTEGSGGSRFGLCRRLDAQLHGTSALAPSKRAPRLAVSVIARMAEAFPIDAEAQREWIAERERWVGKVLDRDRLLSETPLLPTLLAVLACQSKDGKLPTSRAEVLNNAVETAARRWEFAARRQGDVELASLKAAESIEALLESFDLISERLIRTSSLTTDDIRPDLSALLSERWGLPPARSAVAANEAIHFWDEAGMLVLGTGQSLSPRLTLFAEIGAARRLSRREPRAQPKQIKQDLENPSFREMLGLSAGLSLRAGNAIVSYLIKSASLGSGCCGRMLSEHAPPPPDRVRSDQDMKRRDIAWELRRRLASLYRRNSVLSISSVPPGSAGTWSRTRLRTLGRQCLRRLPRCCRTSISSEYHNGPREASRGQLQQRMLSMTD